MSQKINEDSSNRELVQKNSSVRGEVLGSALLMIGSLLPGGAGLLFSVTNWLTSLESRFGSDPLIKQIETLLNQRLTDNAIQQARAELNGLRRNIQEYENALNRWKATPNVNTLSGVVTYYRIVNTNFNTTLSSFKQQNMDVALLPMYAQAACCHLLFLRDASVYGTDWEIRGNANNRGMDPSEVNYYYQQQVKYTAEHTDYCVTTYNKGLDQLRGQSGANVSRWVEFNQLRRNLTISVLDLLPLFPTFDMKSYPARTVSQLSREVYTDPHMDLGSRTRSTGLTFGNMEASLRRPHLSDFLQSLTIFTDQYANSSRYWSGHNLTSRYAGSTIDIPSTLGIRGTVEQERQYSAANPIIQVRQNHFYGERTSGGGITQPPRYFSYRGIYGVTALRDNFSSFTFRHAANQEDNSFDQLPPIDMNNVTRTFTHKVSDVRFVRSPDASTQTNNFTRIPLFIWIHASLSPDNIVLDDAITQIPIAKMNQLNSKTTMIENPGFCGGDIVQRAEDGEFGRFTINNNTGKAIRYQLRIRYASSAAIQFDINLGGNINQRNFDATRSRSQSLTYSTFKTQSYSTPYTMNPGIHDLRISVWNLPNGDSVHIDKIEIVPVDLGVPISNSIENNQNVD